MRARLQTWLEHIWYRPGKPPAYLRVLAWLYGTWLSRQPDPPELNRFPFPVVVIGNVVVGGSGKTPLVIHLTELLLHQNIRVVVIARIYTGQIDGPLLVTDAVHTDAAGDEPKLLAERLNCPVVVSRKRSEAIDFIIKNKIECDIVISDDGLQHNALVRAMEIGVIDSKRHIGNGWLLPAGPLREPIDRLQRCQWLIEKIDSQQQVQFKQTIPMQVSIHHAVHLQTGEQVSLSEFAKQYDEICALAAIADPAAFFEALSDAGIHCFGHAMPDHADITAADVAGLRQTPVLLMTAKDAVKCRELDPPLENAWYVPMTTDLPDTFEAAFIQRCKVLIEQ